MKKVSVIIPVYNAEAYIERCIGSIMNQTYSDYEVVVVDDGSTDKSGMILDKLAEIYPELRVFHSKNHGVSHARNQGIKHAVGVYFCFLDSDDWVEPDFIQCFVERLEETGADMVMGGWLNNQKEIKVEELDQNMTNVEMLKHLYIRKGNHAFALWNKIFKAEYMPSFDEDLSYLEDGLVICKYLKNVKTVNFVDRPLYHYMINDGSITHEYHLNPRRLSSIKASGRMINTVKCYPEVYQLAKVQYYKMVRWILFSAYKCGDGKKVLKYRYLLNRYTKEFLAAKHISVKMKVRFVGYGMILRLNLGSRIAQRWDGFRNQEG